MVNGNRGTMEAMCETLIAYIRPPEADPQAKGPKKVKRPTISARIDKERPRVGLRKDQRRFQSQEIIREMRSVGSLRCHTAEGRSRNDRGSRCAGELHQELHSRCLSDTTDGIR